MGILDGIADQDTMQRAMEQVAPRIDALMKSDRLSPKMRSLLELLGEGLSVGDIIGIEKQHRDAMVVQAGTMMQAGETEKAKEVLEMLSILEPLDERPAYMLGVIALQEERYAVAARLFVHFLALDATNPDGHLRLGECLLSAGELDNAEEAFGTAVALARKTPGGAERVAYGEAMIQSIAARRSAA